MIPKSGDRFSEKGHAPALGDLDGARPFAFRSRDEEREHTIAVFRPYGIRVDIDRYRQRAVEDARNAFASVDARAFIVVDALLSGDPDRVFLGFDLKLLLVHAGQFDHRDEVVS